MVETVEELRRKVASLEEQNRDFVGLINNSYDAFTILDGEGTHLLVSPAIERLTGVKMEEILGQKVSKFRSDMDSTMGASERVIQTGQRQTAVVKTRIGRQLLVTAVPVFDDGGKISRIYCNLRDTTELNRVKEKFEQSQTLMTKYLLELQEVKKLCTMQSQFLAHSKQMKRVLELAFRIARVDARVLILGESGVGKELIARIIHESSPRAQTGTFVKLNCGAIPAELLESELFGYDAGAFTGADRNGKPGYFEVADKGTLLLDEVGDLPLKLQVKLLSVLQDQEITRLGGYRPKKIDVRIIAATNQDLEALVASGAFRKDLFYRLSVVPLHILPLRDRAEDIPFLLIHYLNLNNRKYGLQVRLSKDATDELCAYKWPGNVRELSNLIEYLVVSTDNETIGPRDLPEKYTSGRQCGNGGVFRARPLREEVERYEQAIIKETLSHSGSLEEAAQHLGISLATLVRRKRAMRNNGHP
jgi:PAS domain S-box-containing protein